MRALTSALTDIARQGRRVKKKRKGKEKREMLVGVPDTTAISKLETGGSEDVEERPYRNKRQVEREGGSKPSHRGNKTVGQ